MRAVLEGGAVGGEKSRTPPRLERSICSTYPGSQPMYLPTRIIVDRRSVKIAQSMTSKRTFAPVVRAIIDSPVHVLRMLLEIIVSRGTIIAFTDYERAIPFAIRTFFDNKFTPFSSRQIR